MAAFTFWGDLFKFSTNVLDEDYHYDKNYSIKIKTKSVDGYGDYTFKSEQTKPDESGTSKNSMELKAKFVDEYIVSDSKLRTGGKSISENELKLGAYGEQLKGWSYVLTANLVSGQTLDKSSFASSLKYKQSNIEAKIHHDHSKNDTIEFEGTIKPKMTSAAVVGASAAFNYKTTKIARYGIGFVDRLNPAFSYGLYSFSDDGKNLGNIKFYTLQTVSPTTDVSTEIGYSMHSKDLNARAGFSYRSGLSSMWKGKVSSDGVFGLSFKHIIASGTSLTFSTAFDLGDKALLHHDPHPFGVALEGKY